MALRLESINIMNFKSFRGMHQICGLSGHFTAIVGPNGSGKSNIIDSILFVLGFKARKMRHAILKDLINTGCSECCVELVFNQFRISRSLHGRADEQGNLKSCTGTYMINGLEASSGEAIEFLKEKGIDLDNNRFLILQGEIEAISMMSPLELLDYIEDCVGSSSYKPLIEKLEDETKLKQEELEGRHNSLKFVETDYSFKKGRRDEKIDVLRHRGQSLIFKNKIVLAKAAICDRKRAHLLDEKTQVEGLLGSLCEKSQQSIAKIKNLEERCAKLDIKSKEDDLLRCRREHQRVARENKVREDRRARLEKQIEKIKRDINDNRQALSNWASESELLNQSLLKNNQEIEKYESEIGLRMEELDSFGEVSANEARKTCLEKTLLELMDKRERLFSGDIKLLETKLSALNENISKIRTAKNMDGSRLEKEVSQLRSDIDLTLREINKRKRRAEEFQYVEQAYKKEREVIECLQNVPGVFGHLKNLGTIERGYEDAVEASTKSLSSIVVDSTSTAEECIAIINKRKLSRTTFIILDKLPAPQGEQLKKLGLVKGADVLYKKISCDPMFTKCFYYALKDTLCVRTLEEAKALAFGPTRRRVVTLDGKLLEKSGVMSGGRAGKKIKSVAELEGTYQSMNALLESKVMELEQVRALESQKRLLSTYIEQANSISEEISRKAAGLDQLEFGLIESEISKTKQDIKDLENTQLPLRIVELKGEIRMLNEKIDLLQKVNQDIKIRVGCEPQNCVESLERDLQKRLDEHDCIEMEPLPDLRALDSLERDYRASYDEFMAIQEAINKIRSGMGDDYHQEAELKAKLEEIHDSLSECDRVKENCVAKRKEIMLEFSMARSLLVQVDEGMLGDLDEGLSFIEELDDNELKTRSKEMIEELSLREIEYSKRVKDGAKNGDEFGRDDDIQMYELIFSEYEHSRREYEELKSACDYLESKVAAMKGELEDLKNQRLSKFMEGFNVINKNIKEIFNLITFGGNAELDLIDYLNPFTDGVVLSIMPPKKAWKQISNLSGGEKTLSSISLIFALHKYKPSSFYIMDEIDAALDYKNVSVISQYLSRVDAQFIIISLRNDMFEAAKTLLGVYKDNEVSRVVVVDVDRLVQSV